MTLNKPFFFAEKSKHFAPLVLSKYYSVCLSMDTSNSYLTNGMSLEAGYLFVWPDVEFNIELVHHLQL